MDKLQRIDKLEAELKALRAEIESEKGTLEDVLWKPDIGKDYIIVDEKGDVYYKIWQDDNLDHKVLLNGLVFKTREAAAKHAKRLKVLNVMWQLADQFNDGWEPDFTDGSQHKYMIVCAGHHVIVSACFKLANAQPTFKTEELAERARKLIGDEAIVEAFK